MGQIQKIRNPQNISFYKPLGLALVKQQKITSFDLGDRSSLGSGGALLFFFLLLLRANTETYAIPLGRLFWRQFR